MISAGLDIDRICISFFMIKYTHTHTPTRHALPYELFAFSFLGFEIGVNRFSIKYCIRKATKLENPVKIFLKCPLYSCKTGKCWNQHVFTNLHFDSNPLIFDSTLFPGKNSPNIAKLIVLFSGKGRGDRALILTYLDSPMAEGFSTTTYIFWFRPSSGGNVWSKLDQKCKLWVRLFFINPSISFHTMFLFARALPLVKISAILDPVRAI